MGMWEAVKLYPKAVGWSVLASTALVMEVCHHVESAFKFGCSLSVQGYDLVVIGSFYGLDAFQRKYGVPLNDGTGKWSITAAWQSGLSNGANVGEIIGKYSHVYNEQRTNELTINHRTHVCWYSSRTVWKKERHLNAGI